MAATSWHSDAYPELRSGPPWVMQEMIAAQPLLAEQMLRSPSPAASAIADEIASALASARPITVTGCGTSEHAAHAIASLTARSGARTAGAHPSPSGAERRDRRRSGALPLTWLASCEERGG
jgi:fructoselysine-6-P-deglycase FrlB-like protein